MSRARTDRGFTLLEVMVALAILVMGLMAISDVVGGALRNHVRAHDIEVATLLARGKMAELEDHFEDKGFRDFDETDEGSFDKEGHPDVHWKVEALRPDVGPDGKAFFERLTGGKSIEETLGLPAGSLDANASKQSGSASNKQPGTTPGGGTGPQTTFPGASMLSGMIQQQLNTVTEQVKKGLREVRLTVSWPDGRRTESFTVVTHMVVLAPREPVH